ncbi:DUF1289 domain-containing protein [Pelistega sp. NLN82]|uniref:DUF1289 domain-containing protein n=1 Tax=Pelistega ratti TaxID=2652177 RepID=A0A6L9Y625_9BURK|nr:DUF1289 domain-containing protein [Pelistega ratti]NEN75942.1 DUF1289 domain-containing protein [Pelistega ratti]
MEQLEFFEIPSPCISVCQSNEKGYCMGCFRTRDERFHWQQLSDSQKRDVLKACRIRRVRAVKEKLAKIQKAPEVVNENLTLF